MANDGFPDEDKSQTFYKGWDLSCSSCKLASTPISTQNQLFRPTTTQLDLTPNFLAHHHPFWPNTNCFDSPPPISTQNQPFWPTTTQLNLTPTFSAHHHPFQPNTNLFGPMPMAAATATPAVPSSTTVKLGVRMEMSGPKSCETLASTCRLRRSLDGCLKFWRSGRSRSVRNRAEKKLKGDERS